MSHSLLQAYKLATTKAKKLYKNTPKKTCTERELTKYRVYNTTLTKLQCNAKRMNH